MTDERLALLVRAAMRGFMEAVLDDQQTKDRLFQAVVKAMT